MNRKLTISIDEQVYHGLVSVIGRGSIGRFLEGLARPFVDRDFLNATYEEMANDNAREINAAGWVDTLSTDETHVPW